jgi:antitoxin VapB
MERVAKVRIFMSGRSQAVRIPAEYHFTTDEVYIRRDPHSGDLILSEAPGGWDKVFADLDKAGFPEDFLADRGQGSPQGRDELNPAVPAGTGRIS